MRHFVAPEGGGALIEFVKTRAATQRSPRRIARMVAIVGWRKPGKDQAVHDPEGLPLGQMPALYDNLMPKDQDLGYQRSSRPEQPDQRRPNKAARFPHRTEALRDSASAVSPIRFTTGTGSHRSVQRKTRRREPAEKLRPAWGNNWAAPVLLSDYGRKPCHLRYWSSPKAIGTVQIAGRLV